MPPAHGLRCNWRYRRNRQYETARPSLLFYGCPLLLKYLLPHQPDSFFQGYFRFPCRPFPDPGTVQNHFLHLHLPDWQTVHFQGFAANLFYCLNDGLEAVAFSIPLHPKIIVPTIARITDPTYPTVSFYNTCPAYPTIKEKPSFFVDLLESLSIKRLSEKSKKRRL